MKRPWPVVAILIITILAVILGVVGNVYTLRLASEGVLDPANQAIAMSPVHLAFGALELVLSLAAASFLYRLRGVAPRLFAGVLVVQLAHLVYFWITMNYINVDVFLLVTIVGISYSYYLFRRGVLD